MVEGRERTIDQMEIEYDQLNTKYEELKESNERLKEFIKRHSFEHAQIHGTYKSKIEELGEELKSYKNNHDNHEREIAILVATNNELQNEILEINDWIKKIRVDLTEINKQMN